MDIPQYGESSRSPQAIRTGLNGSIGSNGDTANGHAESLDRKLARLILPEWDVPPAKHLHVSHDAITLLHLDTLYNTHVRPYANPNIGEDGVKDEHDDDDMGETHGAKRKKGPKRRKMEKGYTHLIDDCIDPTPLGEGRNTHSLLPLIPDMMQPPLGPPPELYPDALTVLPSGIFQNARLEAGSKVDGYSNGVKAGVAEAEEKRRRKKLRQSQSALPPDLPSPALPSPMDSSELAAPVQPIAPPAHLSHRTPFPVNTTGRGAFRGGAGTPSRGSFRGRGAGPFTPSRGGTPGTPMSSFRGRGGFPGPGTPRGTPSRGGMSGMGGGTPRLPNPAWNRDGPGSGVKRPADGNSTYTPDPKRSKAGQESRSVSPFVGEQAGSTQGRPGIGKTPRSKTGE